MLEGEHGFYRAFAGGHDEARLESLLASLGTTWEIEQLTFKPYPCGSIAQPYMDCALRVRERHRVRPEDIVEIRCRTADGPVPRLWEPLAAKHAPQNGYAAKFSLPYLLAVVLIRQRNLAQCEPMLLAGLHLCVRESPVHGAYQSPGGRLVEALDILHEVLGDFGKDL